MSLKQEILERVRNIVKEPFYPKDVKYVPEINNQRLTLGNTGLTFSAAVLYIDMRKSTQILDTHQRKNIAKIHMAYFHAITSIVTALGGKIRSFNGDSVLAFFPGSQKECIHKAVEAAMKIKYIISHTEDGINEVLDKKYSKIDYGIGIDYGEILCTKVGIEKTYNTMDLIWIGHAVNRSTKLSEAAQHPSHIIVSQKVYNTLDDEFKLKEEKFWGLLPWNKDKWNSTTIEYNEEEETCYATNDHLEVE